MYINSVLCTCSHLALTAQQWWERRRHIALAVINDATFFALGFTTSLGCVLYVWPRRYAPRVWLLSFRKHYLGAVKGMPGVDVVLRRHAYAIGYSNAHRCALWASFIMCHKSLKLHQLQGEIRTETFSPDPDVTSEFRAAVTDFINTGYDKGHMAPRASIGYSGGSCEESFLLTNVALQHPALNRIGWRRLEDYSRRWTKAHSGPVFVTVGPIFSRQPPPKQINRISVPSAFYMALLHCHSRRAIGFVMENENQTSEEVTDLGNFAMSLPALEKKLSRQFDGNPQIELFGYVSRLWRPLRQRNSLRFFVHQICRRLGFGKVMDDSNVPLSKGERRFWHLSPKRQ